MDTNDFVLQCKKLPDEELMAFFGKKDEFTEEYLNIVEAELAIRGYNPSEITSSEEAQKIVLRKKTDAELFQLLTDRENTFFSSNLLQQEYADRGLSKDSFEEYTEVRGIMWLLVGLPIVGSVVIPVLYLLLGDEPKSGSVLTLAALAMAIYYRAARHKLPSGKKVPKYDGKTRTAALIVLVCILGLILVNILIILPFIIGQ